MKKIGNIFIFFKKFKDKNKMHFGKNLKLTTKLIYTPCQGQIKKD